MRFVRSNAAVTAAGPVLFGGAFLAPLIAQSLEAASLPVPFGLAPIHLGLALGLTLGVFAALRGRWV
ncbi:MAG: hypothetical protein QNK04_02925 [Myxococcota bacterium]|nr:hypothetical protein [Myxococcota bacterium]